jgi:phosphoribosylamine--glycine ligase
LLPLLVSAAQGTIGTSFCRLSTDKLVGVVLASRGYPATSSAGDRISGIDAAESARVNVYHAGTALKDGQLVTSGGRVLTVVGRSADFADAIARAYDGVSRISFDGMQYRRDIGRKALRSQPPSLACDSASFGEARRAEGATPGSVDRRLGTET